MRPADQLKAIEMLLDRGFDKGSPQQLDIAHSVSDRPLEHLLYPHTEVDHSAIG